MADGDKQVLLIGLQPSRTEIFGRGGSGHGGIFAHDASAFLFPNQHPAGIQEYQMKGTGLHDFFDTDTPGFFFGSWLVDLFGRFFPVIPVKFSAFGNNPGVSVVVEDKVIESFGQTGSLKAFFDIVTETSGTGIDEIETVKVLGPQQPVAAVIACAYIVHTQGDGVGQVADERLEAVAVVHIEHTLGADQYLAVFHLCEEAYLIIEKSVSGIQQPESFRRGG